MDRLMLTHTVQGLCTTVSSCAQSILNIQNLGACDPVDDFTDIPFGFIIGGDGFVFEGRGFDIQGEHTRGEQ
jgi:N-acetylmuramoyl-L-alanine amidase